MPKKVSRFKKHPETLFFSALTLTLGVLAILIGLLFIKKTQEIRQKAKEAPAEYAGFAKDVPLENTKTPIFRLGVDANVSFKNNRATARVVLIDVNNREFVVFETYSALSEQTSLTVVDACEETCILEGIIPHHLRLEGYEATIEIMKTSTIDNSSKLTRKNKTLSLAQEKKLIESENLAKKIETLNSLNKKLGKRWVAGETDFAKLPYEKKKKLFRGNMPNLQGFEFYKSGIFEIAYDPTIVKKTIATATPRFKRASSGTIPPAPVTPPWTAPPITPPPSSTPKPTISPFFPKSWDWRNRHGVNWVTPVRDQMACGSCWAFGSIAAVEAATNLYYNQLINLDLSEQETVCRHPGSCINGGFHVDPLEELKSTGLVTELCYPYTGTESCSGPCSNASSATWKITNYTSIWDTNNDDTVKQALITKGPIPFGIYSWWHMMAAVGFESDPVTNQTIWILKNSWGSTWGEAGFGKVIVNPNDRYSSMVIDHPYLASNPIQYQVSCNDKDADTYCSWGVGSKPSSCPVTCKPEPDCDDANATLGKFDASYNCTLNPNPTITPRPVITPPPTSTPRPVITPRPTLTPCSVCGAKTTNACFRVKCPGNAKCTSVRTQCGNNSACYKATCTPRTNLQ